METRREIASTTNAEEEHEAGEYREHLAGAYKYDGRWAYEGAKSGNFRSEYLSVEYKTAPYGREWRCFELGLESESNLQLIGTCFDLQDWYGSLTMNCCVAKILSAHNLISPRLRSWFNNTEKKHPRQHQQADTDQSQIPRSYIDQ